MAASQQPVSASRDPDFIVKGHPRLYCTGMDLDRLRADRAGGWHAMIWKNIAESADWCLTQTPRKEWIAPVADDPIYENLYDRFYAMMMDMAITEHLAFAYALSGDARYGDAARQWTLAACRAWRNDADAAPDDGKAYAVMRLLKGAAVGYDLVYNRFTEEERSEIREMLSRTAANYYQHYFTLPSAAGPANCTHHAIVQFSSFGVVSLALLGETPEAAEWANAVTRKFEEHLLPSGLATDNAQVEGSTFWASTMQYRLFYMDALRRVTGKDLFAPYKQYMAADLALASIAAEKQPEWNEPHQTVVFSPSYGQLDYYAPILLCLAQIYRRPIHQYLAFWDHTLGQIQKTRYITPNRREQLMFELGGYAYVWYDSSVPVPRSAEIDEHQPLSYEFPSVCQAYARASWKPRDILVAMDKGGQTIVHAGGTAVLIASGPSNDSKQPPRVRDDKATAVLEWRDEGSGAQVTMELQRPNRLTARWKSLKPGWSFWSLRTPGAQDDRLVWDSGVEMRFVKGRLKEINPQGYAPVHAVGNGKLNLIDPMPTKYATISVDLAGDGELEIQILNQIKEVESRP